MKVAEAIVWVLHAWDLRYVFGVSGANIEYLHDAIFRSNGKVRSVLAKSEIGAAFMADGRARAHGTLGVCCATSGGGMMNLAVGIAESYADRVPVLAIIGQVPREHEGYGGFQDSSGKGQSVDGLALLQSITKLSARLTEAGQIWGTLENAAREALSGAQGPTALLIPRDLFDLDAGDPPNYFPRKLDGLVKPCPLDVSAVYQVHDVLCAAEHPVIIVGREAQTKQLSDALIEFATAARILTATTMASPTAFPNNHPMYLGCIGAAGHPSTHDYLNEKADVILAIGTELGVMLHQPLKRALSRAKIIAIARDITQIKRNVALNLAICAQPEEAVKALLELYRIRPFLLDIEKPRLRRYAAQLDDVPGEIVGDALLQSQAIELLESIMPVKGNVFFDAGNCAAAGIHGMRFPKDCKGIIALGMGGMGYAIAGAIGAQLGAKSSERTVVLTGDGAFLVTGLEVHTAVMLGLRILYVIFNNAKHGMCVTRQKLFFDGRVDCTEYDRVEIASLCRGIAQPHQLWVGRAETKSEMVRALSEYQSTSTLTGVLELVLAHEERPPFAPFLPVDSQTIEVPFPSGETN